MKYQPITEEQILSLDLDVELNTEAWNTATALVAAGVELSPLTYAEIEQGAPLVIEEGAPFVIDVLLPEEVESGDSRTFEGDSVTVLDDLPIPLLWQQFTNKGHDGSVVIGRIDYIERLQGPMKGWGNARGVLDTGVYAREAERLIRGKFIRGVSADLDKFEASQEASPEEALDEATIKNDKVTIKKSRLVAATVVAKPAFQEARIRIEDPVIDYIEIPLTDGVYEEEYEDEFAMESSIIAAAIPVRPPSAWFENPKFSAPSAFTVTDEGQVFGHIAAWGTNHIGMQRNTRPPRSASNYAYFRTGVLRTQEGNDIPVGQLTLSGGHADLNATFQQAVKHYDDTQSAIADVAIGEDRYGIWVAGALRPGVTEEQIRAFRAANPSGDWRPVQGRNLELVAVCMVNVPGFPIARSLVASGHVFALVAAGAKEIAKLNPYNQLDERISAIETKELQKEAEEAFSVLEQLEMQEREALVASAQEALSALSSLEKAENEREASKYATIIDKLSSLM